MTAVEISGFVWDEPTPVTASHETGNAEKAAIEAAKAWAEKLPACHEEALFPAERAIVDAVRALEPPAPVLPPEEPGDRTVIRVLDRGGLLGEVVDVLERDDRLANYSPRHWWRTGMPRAQTWDEVLQRGPIEILVPQAETFPRDLAGELVEVLRDSLPCWDPTKGTGCAYAAAKAILARATAALTDGATA